MLLTHRQGVVVAKLENVVYRLKKSGRFGYILGKEDVSNAINSLLMKGVLVRDVDNHRLRLSEKAIRFVRSAGEPTAPPFVPLASQPSHAP